VRDIVEMLAAVGIVVGGLFLTTFLITVGIVNATAQGFPVRLEAVRGAVAQLGCTASEDVMGQAVVFNKEIASARYWDTVPVLQLLAAAPVVNAQPIDLPRCAQ
jgi:hypothetical protein